MNDPAPKPCPFCSKPAEMVQQGCYGCSDRECPAYLANIVLRLWNRRPNPETQAVAYRNPETGHVCSREKWESMGSSFRQGMRQPLYAAPEVKENDD